MHYDNRRLREIQLEKSFFKELIEKAESKDNISVFESKLKLLEDEEKRILKRYKVNI